MKNLNISSIEWEILRIVWKHKKISVKEVMKELSNPHKRAYTTIQTYMERMTEKGFLKKEKIGLVNFYQAIINKKNFINSEISKFIQNVFAGSLLQFAAYLFDSENLKREDIEAIKGMIEKRKEEDD